MKYKSLLILPSLFLFGCSINDHPEIEYIGKNENVYEYSAQSNEVTMFPKGNSIILTFENNSYICDNYSHIGNEYIDDFHIIYFSCSSKIKKGDN